MDEANVFIDEYGEHFIKPEGAPVAWRPSSYAYVEREGRVLLVWPHPLKYWMLPGGAVVCGKETTAEGAVRECLEETGYRIRIRGDARPAFSERKFRLTLTGEWLYALIFIYEAELVSEDQDLEVIGCPENSEQNITEIEDPKEHIRWHSLADLDLTMCHPCVRPYLMERRERLIHSRAH